MWKQRKQCIWKGLGSGQTWNRSQQKLTKLADEQGSSLSLCAEAFRSCLSAPPNLIKLLKGAHCLDVNTWQFGSVECELPGRCSWLALLFIFAFSAILQIPNIILSSLSQYFCSCLLCIWKLGVCLSITLYVQGHGLVLTYQMSGFYFALRDYLHVPPSSLPYQPNSWCNSADFWQAPWAVKQVHFAFCKSCQRADRKEGSFWMSCTLSE